MKYLHNYGNIKSDGYIIYVKCIYLWIYISDLLLLLLKVKIKILKC